MDPRQLVQAQLDQSRHVVRELSLRISDLIRQCRAADDQRKRILEVCRLLEERQLALLQNDGKEETAMTAAAAAATKQVEMEAAKQAAIEALKATNEAVNMAKEAAREKEAEREREAEREKKAAQEKEAAREKKAAQEKALAKTKAASPPRPLKRAAPQLQTSNPAAIQRAMSALVSQHRIVDTEMLIKLLAANVKDLEPISESEVVELASGAKGVHAQLRRSDGRLMFANNKLSKKQYQILPRTKMYKVAKTAAK